MPDLKFSGKCSSLAFALNGSWWVEVNSDFCCRREVSPCVPLQQPIKVQFDSASGESWWL